MPTPKVQLLLTGNELMTGDIVDSNSALMAQVLKELGLEVSRKVTVSDDLDSLISEINHMANNSDILIINGGLGPTIDDLTSQALAEATGRELTQNKQALAHLELWCKNRGAELNKPNLKQADLPLNCQIIPNKNGSAVGFSVRYKECDIYCTPGVPHELKTMLSEEIMPIIKQGLPKDLIADVVRLQVFGLGESTLQEMINKQLPDWPNDLDLGFRAGAPLLEVKLTTNSLAALALKKKWLSKLKVVLGDHLIAEVNERVKCLAEHLHEDLQKQSLKITTAESCTGGLIASQLTSISGSSSSFEAGFVTYSNEMKTDILNVQPELIQRNGAVSEAVVIAMAEGALEKSKADLAIAVSGVAGPNGGTQDKPVGTVWLAWGASGKLKTQCLLLPYGRVKFQQMVAAIGLDLVRRHQNNLHTAPDYIIKRAFPAIQKVI